jgi:CheY-like chemotaxis protein
MSRSIVWVDDDNDLLESVVEPLEWAGYSVKRLRTLQEARDAMPDIRQADLLLLDMILPTGQDDQGLPSHFTGLAFLGELRQHDIRTPVVVLTVVSRVEDTDQYKDLQARNPGVVKVVHKPVLPQELKRVVDSVLSASELQDATLT